MPRSPIFLIGLHGCGKSTVGQHLQERHGYLHISVGSLARLAKKRRLPVEFSHTFMVRLCAHLPGMPMSPRLIESLLAEISIHNQYRPVVVDGFPASVDHVKTLPAACVVVNLSINESVRQERLIHRSQTTNRKWTPGMSSQRDDDLPEVVKAIQSRVDMHSDISLVEIDVSSNSVESIVESILSNLASL